MRTDSVFHLKSISCEYAADVPTSVQSCGGFKCLCCTCKAHELKGLPSAVVGNVQLQLSMLKFIPRFLLRHNSEATIKFSSPLLSACHGDRQGNGTTNAPSRDFSVLQIGDVLQEQPQPSSRPFSGQRHPSISSGYQGSRSFAASTTEPELDASLEAVNMHTLQNALQSHFPLTDDHQVSACM